MSRALLPAAYLAMEAAWVTGVLGIWGRWLGERGAGVLVPPWLGATTLAVAYLVGRRLLRREVLGGRARLWAAGALLAGTALALAGVWLSRHAGEGPGWLAGLGGDVGRMLHGPSPDLGALLGGIVLWWRGLRAGAEPPDYPAVVRSFGIGTLALSGATVLGGMGLGVPIAVQAAIVVFLCGGLVGLSAARLRDAAQEVEAGQVRGNATQIERAWMRTTLAPVGGVLLAAGAGALVVGDAAWRNTVLATLSGVGDLIWRVFYWPLVLIGVLAEWLVRLLQRLPSPSPAEPVEVTPSDFGSLLVTVSRGGGLPPEWTSVLRWLATAAMLAVFAAALYATSRVVWRGREPESDRVEAERESLWSWRDLWRSLLHRVGQMLRHPHATSIETEATLTADATLLEPPITRDARQAYRQMLAIGRAHGVAREPAETPGEYYDRWRTALPGEAEVGALTSAYETVRYAAPGVAPKQTGALAGLLARLTERLGRARSASA